MADRRAQRTVKRIEPVPESNGTGTEYSKEPQVRTEGAQFIDIELEVQQQIAAVRAMRDVEIEHLQTELHLLRSCFNKELLQKPVLRFFEENFSDLSVVNDKNNKKFEIRWNNEDSRLSMNCADQRYAHASFLQRLSIAYLDCAAAIAPLGGYECSSKAGAIRNTDSHDARCSSESCGGSQRSSVGMTPKRLSRPGEMLLSVHGSPFGVYKENNMEAIHESEECRMPA